MNPRRLDTSAFGTSMPPDLITLPMQTEFFTSLMTDAQLLLRMRATMRVYACVLGGPPKQGGHPRLLAFLFCKRKQQSQHPDKIYRSARLLLQ